MYQALHDPEASQGGMQRKATEDLRASLCRREYNKVKC